VEEVLEEDGPGDVQNVAGRGVDVAFRHRGESRAESDERFHHRGALNGSRDPVRATSAVEAETGAVTERLVASRRACGREADNRGGDTREQKESTEGRPQAAHAGFIPLSSHSPGTVPEQRDFHRCRRPRRMNALITVRCALDAERSPRPRPS